MRLDPIRSRGFKMDMTATRLQGLRPAELAVYCTEELHERSGHIAGYSPRGSSAERENNEDLHAHAHSESVSNHVA